MSPCETATPWWTKEAVTRSRASRAMVGLVRFKAYQNQNIKTLYFMVTGNPQLMEEDWVVFGLYLATVYCMIVRKNAL